MKKILIIAGPNGAGKTTFAGEFLLREADCPEFVNADLIAAGLSPFQPDKIALEAGRIMVHRIQNLVGTGDSFAFETTLAARGYLRHIPSWQSAGYQVELHYLRLPDSRLAIQRVRQRVLTGGHYIPEETVIRRFARSLDNLGLYKDRVDSWCIYDSSRFPPVVVESDTDFGPDLVHEDAAEFTAAREADSPGKIPNGPGSPAALAALKRAAQKAIERARAAGLEPVFAPQEKDLP